VKGEKKRKMKGENGRGGDSASVFAVDFAAGLFGLGAEGLGFESGAVGFARGAGFDARFHAVIEAFDALAQAHKAQAAVLALAAGLAGFDDDPGRAMAQAHAGFDLVLVLATGSAGAKGLEIALGHEGFVGGW
jgi:hypothetical protein